MKQFAETVRAMVEASTGKEVTTEMVTKVNETKLAICIKDGVYGANFYIEDFYEDGMSEDGCADMIIEAYKNCAKPNVDIDNFDFSFEAIKDKLIARVVSIEKNKELLDTVVYKDMGCGLAVIPAVEPAAEYLFNVSKSLAEDKGYDTETLVETALENDERIRPATLTTMFGSLFGGAKNLLDAENSNEEIGAELLVLTNDKAFMGASAIFHNGILDRAHEIIGDDFYVLPSSIHETILVPNGMEKTPEALKTLVMNANRDVVESKDYLSDDVFFFDGELRKVA